MADDIAPELLEKVQSDYRKLRENDKELARISERTAAGSADGKDLDAYAVREGELLAEALHRNVSGDVLPNGKMYFNIADRVLPSALRENYDNVADMSERIIAGMNDRAGIHIRAQRPELNEDRVKGLVNLAATADQYEDRRKEIEADVVNFSQSVGTDTVRKNADFQYQSGLSPKIHRTAEGGCCKWCAGLAGTYDYASVKGSGSDVWQRHRDCRCIVEFDPGNGRRQNAHTKAWRSDEDKAKRIEHAQAVASLFSAESRRNERIQLERNQAEERGRKIHYGETKQFDRDGKSIKAREIENYSKNNIYVSDDVTISPREARWINNSIANAKNILGIGEQCNIPVIIVNDQDRLAGYNPRTNTMFVSSRMANKNEVIKLQLGYAAADNPDSTMVHELIHWQDAEDYRITVGIINSAEPKSEYTIYQRDKAEIALIKAGVDLADGEQIRKISQYAYEEWLENRLEEVYTEYRTKIACQ